MNNYVIEYKDIRKAIIKACNKVGKVGADFVVDYAKLKASITPIGLVPLCINLEGNRIKVEDIPILSEYFIKSKLSWITNSKFTSTLIFVTKEAVDNDTTGELRALLNRLEVDETEDPTLDKVAVASKIVGFYPCYFGCIVSYRSNDPDRVDRNSYEIMCRANKIVLSDPNYKYNPKDMV